MNISWTLVRIDLCQQCSPEKRFTCRVRVFIFDRTHIASAPQTDWIHLDERYFPRQKKSFEQKIRNTSTEMVNKVLRLIGTRGSLGVFCHHRAMAIDTWSMLYLIWVLSRILIRTNQSGDWRIRQSYSVIRANERTRLTVEEKYETWMSHQRHPAVFTHDKPTLVDRKQRYRESLRIIAVLDKFLTNGLMRSIGSLQE